MGGFRQYAVELKGLTDILMHANEVEWEDYLKAWRKDPEHKKFSVPGDDRSPQWTWIGYLYVENNKIVMPSDNLMSTFRDGGSKCPTGKGQTTFKRQSQSGIIVDQSSWPLLVGGHEIDYAPIKALIDNSDFEAHKKLAEDMGFTLLCKRATIGRSKHLRVRPRFANWSCSGTVTVSDEMITTDVLNNIISYAGAYAGLCDWRPGSPKSPGPWGKFEAIVKEIER